MKIVEEDELDILKTVLHFMQKQIHTTHTLNSQRNFLCFKFNVCLRFLNHQVEIASSCSRNHRATRSVNAVVCTLTVKAIHTYIELFL